MSVNWLRRLTPPIPIHSMTCGADRHSDPTPNDSWFLYSRDGYGGRPIGGRLCLPVLRAAANLQPRSECCRLGDRREKH